MAAAVAIGHPDEDGLVQLVEVWEAQGHGAPVVVDLVAAEASVVAADLAEEARVDPGKES